MKKSFILIISFLVFVTIAHAGNRIVLNGQWVWHHPKAGTMYINIHGFKQTTDDTYKADGTVEKSKPYSYSNWDGFLLNGSGNIKGHITIKDNVFSIYIWNPDETSSLLIAGIWKIGMNQENHAYIRLSDPNWKGDVFLTSALEGQRIFPE